MRRQREAESVFLNTIRRHKLLPGGGSVIVALSGGYSQAEANERLARNKGLIASFSRALVEGLSAKQSDAEFNATLQASIAAICAASAT